MKASDYIAQQLLASDDPYNLRHHRQPRMPISVRLPVELVAWINVLQSRGVGTSRSEVIQILLDVAVEQVANMDVFGDDLRDAVDAVTDGLTEQIMKSR